MKLNRELLPREKSSKEEMLLAPESGVRYDIDLKNQEKCVARTQTLTRPVPLDTSLS
jgi:hypothetical protein